MILTSGDDEKTVKKRKRGAPKRNCQDLANPSEKVKTEGLGDDESARTLGEGIKIGHFRRSGRREKGGTEMEII